MSRKLVIVESPAKAKTIEKYLGKDFRVLSSIGHIRSIAKKGKDGSDAIDIKNDFATTYEIDTGKKKVIAELRKAVKVTNEVWLATDEDREGEAIAWHLCEVLKLDPAKTKRIVFHEITKSAIDKAIKNPRTVDMDLVRAQQARQILDRIVGFDLSDVVRRKVPGGISAGRVQSPGVRLLVEREREVEAFEGASQFRITAEFEDSGELFRAELSKRYDNEPDATKFLEGLIGARFNVLDVSKNPATRNPSAPFTTSTLQQEANTRLGFGTKTTMSAAQKLYQEGKITYMRTDSVNLSGQALAQISEYIQVTFGKSYHQVRKFKTKSASAQEAHEAIRPTDVSVEQASSDNYCQKLYDLIRRRTLASQMATAKLEKTTIKISTSSKEDAIFEAKGEVIVFDGYLKIYESQKNEGDLLPEVKINDRLFLKSAQAKQTFAKPPARYSEGSLVKKLEELGIGRPSTYATIISTIQVREYATKGTSEGTEREAIVLSLKGDQIDRDLIQEKVGSDKGKLVPTPRGMLMSDFLIDHFNPIVDYNFTAKVEEDFDDISEGKLERNKMLRNFYSSFKELLDKTGEIERSAVAKAREVGTDPKTGKTIYARFGRFGPMLQLGSNDNKDEKPQFAPMPRGARVESVTLEQATKAFELPRTVGKTDDGQEIKANIGRFGPYIQIGKLFVSIKPFDPHTITPEEAKNLYIEKLKAEAEKNISDFGDGIKILKGRFGPYVTDGNTNAKISKDLGDPGALTHDQAKELLARAPGLRKGFSNKRRKSNKKNK